MRSMQNGTCHSLLLRVNVSSPSDTPYSIISDWVQRDKDISHSIATTECTQARLLHMVEPTRKHARVAIIYVSYGDK